MTGGLQISLGLRFKECILLEKMFAAIQSLTQHELVISPGLDSEMRPCW